MTTIGYGDIIPKNKYERIYIIFCALFSCGMFAYTLNSIGKKLKFYLRTYILLNF